MSSSETSVVEPKDGIAAEASTGGKQDATSPSIWAKLNHWTGLDRAIGFAVMARVWAALAGVVMVLLIARFLSLNEQGYYYTFYSLVALQVLFELGFFYVVLQLAAHELARLTIAPDGRIKGDPVAHSRLASVLQKCVRWYSIAAVLMVATLLPAGLYFFSKNQHTDASVAWKGPWCLLVVAAAITFQLDPVTAFVEGCGFISDMARMRLVQGLVGSTLAWTAMVTHHGLYSPAMMIVGMGSVQIAFLSGPTLRHLLTGLLRHHVSGNGIRWRQEVWPFQWRIAITWTSSYLISLLFNPVVFMFRGPIEAGRMGMSINITAAIGAVGIAWVSTKASPMGNLVARGEIAKLDKLFFRTLWQSTVLLATGAAGLYLCLVIGGHRFPKLAMRVLPPWALGLLLVTTLMNHVLFTEALYLRAHKREPFLVQALVVLIIIVTSTLLLAKFWGADGVAVGYFLFGGLLSLAWRTQIFNASRREWYGSSATRGELVCAGEPVDR